MRGHRHSPGYGSGYGYGRGYGHGGGHARHVPDKFDIAISSRPSSSMAKVVFPWEIATTTFNRRDYSDNYQVYGKHIT